LENNIAKFVFVSSSSVYSGPHDRLNIKEEEVDQSNDLNFYIKTKIMAEKIINDYAEKHDLSCSIIRPHGIFGIGDTSIMPRLLKVNKKIGIPLFNKGNNLMDIVCAENIAYSLWLCANSGRSGTYNITNGEITTYKQLVSSIFSRMGMEAKHFNMNFKVAYFIAGAIEKIYKILKIESEPILTRYTLTTVGVSETFDLSKARKELGYEPQKTLHEGIDAYAKWWKENN
jgi:dTDP-4-dehydrorhamnose 3,5-epimerase